MKQLEHLQLLFKLCERHRKVKGLAGNVGQFFCERIMIKKRHQIGSGQICNLNRFYVRFCERRNLLGEVKTPVGCCALLDRLACQEATGLLLVPRAVIMHQSSLAPGVSTGEIQ